MLSWLSGRASGRPAEDPQEVRCRMGVHERGAIVAEGSDLVSTCQHCRRRLGRVAGEWRVMLSGGAQDPSTASRQGRTHGQG